MINETIYYCPKCNSSDIEITCLNPPEPKKISMDDIGKSSLPKLVDLVLRTYNYHAKCNNCGYTVEYNI